MINDAEPAQANETDQTGRQAEDPAETVSTPRRRRVLLVAGAATVVVAVAVAGVAVVRAGQTTATGTPASIPVAVAVKHVPATGKIGVVVTLGAGDGSQWNTAAQGAVVAQHRLRRGKSDVTLVTKNDRGTAAGAAGAVRSLVADGVSGIVIATSGRHVSAATKAAAAAGVPVVLPYEREGGDGAWTLAPDEAGVGAAIAQALGDATEPVLVDFGGSRPTGVTFAEVIEATTAADDAQTVGRVVALAKAAAPKKPIDAIVVSGPAPRQARLIAALQATDLSLPYVLTPDATSPVFGRSLVEAGGSTFGVFATVGGPVGDSIALRSDASGRAMSAFLAGVRIASASSTLKNLTGDQAFSAVAQDADSRSHDAVILLVQAMGAARSAEPTKVGAALSELTLGPRDGIAGPTLGLASPSPVSGDPSVLYASGQPLGMRGAGADGVLTWFADEPAE